MYVPDTWLTWGLVCTNSDLAHNAMQLSDNMFGSYPNLMGVYE